MKKVRVRKRVVEVTEKQCPVCGEWWAPKRFDAKVCSSGCRVRLKRKRDSRKKS